MKKTLLTLALCAITATAAHAEFKAGMTPAQITADMKAQIAKAPVTLESFVAAALAAKIPAGDLAKGIKGTGQFSDTAIVAVMVRGGYSAEDTSKAAAAAGIPSATIIAGLVDSGKVSQADASKLVASNSSATKTGGTGASSGTPSSAGSGSSGSGGGGGSTR